MKIPNEILEFWSLVRPLNNAENGMNFLLPEASLSYAVALSEIEIFKSLGLIPLEDSNNSNPVCFISNGPASGMVMLLSHDEGSKIIFNSLSEFQSCLIKNTENIDFFSEFIEEFPAIYNDNKLVPAIASLLSSTVTDESEFLICLYTQSVKTFSIELVGKYIHSGGMYIQEALFNQLSIHPNGELLPLLESAVEFHPQVQPLYKKALSKIKATYNN